jgi:antirestriction protein ArdC
MFENTTGYSNIAFGYDAGRRISGGGANQTSNTSIYIGEDTRSSANGNTNEMVFGHNAVGQGSNTVTLGNSSITQTLLRGTVTGGSFVRSGGTSSQVLYADGGVKQITSGTAAPSGGNDGDIYLQYV